jgi:hypothetical protein
MLSISVLDADGRDMMQESPWLSVGREYRPSLQTPHLVTIRRGDTRFGSVRVRERAGTKNVLKVDSIQVAEGSARELVAAVLYAALREARIVAIRDLSHR